MEIIAHAQNVRDLMVVQIIVRQHSISRVHSRVSIVSRFQPVVSFIGTHKLLQKIYMYTKLMSYIIQDIATKL